LSGADGKKRSIPCGYETKRKGQVSLRQGSLKCVQSLGERGKGKTGNSKGVPSNEPGAELNRLKEES